MARKCISCRVSSPKGDLLRIAFGQGWFFDFAQVAPGRGFYVHIKPGCLRDQSFQKGYGKTLEKLKSSGKLKDSTQKKNVFLKTLIEEGSKKLEELKKAGVKQGKLKWAQSRLEDLSHLMNSLQEEEVDKAKFVKKKRLRL